jgi:type VI protein secretion system component Hcp
MAGMQFCRIDGAPGDAKDQGFSGCLNIEPVSINASNQGSFSVGGGGNVGGGGRPSGLSINAVMCKATPEIFKKIVSGDVTPKVEIISCKMVGKQQVVFQKATLTNVYFTQLDIGSGTSSEGLPMASFGCEYEKIKLEYTPVSNTGAKGATTTAEWDAMKNDYT